MQKLLRAFGCTKFGHMTDDAAGTLLVQFEYRGRQVCVTASAKGYAAAWLRQHKTSSANAEKALKLGNVAVYSILRDWIKGQITAIETGVLSFEGAFLGQILLPNGRTVLEHAAESKLIALEGPTA
jgi:predicted NBD/HSP70 family sugar kinase